MASIDEYGYVTLDDSTSPSSSSRSGSSSSSGLSSSSGNNTRYNNNHSGGGKGCVIILGIISLIVIVGVFLSAINNQENDMNYLSNNQNTNTTYNGTYYEDVYDDSDEYILPNSDSEYISYSDLASLSKTEVILARNEIYARHGRKFKTDYIREYFESKSWYNPHVNPDDFSESVFNKYEKENIQTILKYEKDKGWK